jgi:hypothetical protein
VCAHIYIFSDDLPGASHETFVQVLDPLPVVLAAQFFDDLHEVLEALVHPSQHIPVMMRIWEEKPHLRPRRADELAERFARAGESGVQ